MSRSMPDSSQKNLKGRPWGEAETLDLKRIKGVCLDIDDTLSTHGQLEAPAYEALWKLKQAGLVVIPITGRPAGWCDLISRFWPVDAVVGENGAFTFYLEKKGKLRIKKRINTPTNENESSLKAKLESLGNKIKLNFPNAKWASDQAYREYDLAIDICEDVERWSSSEVERLLQLCRAEGAHAKLSSIHVNTWFGNYDKRKGFDYWMDQGGPGVVHELPSLDQWLYIGDSPNDEPMFETFKYSVGVANLRDYLEQLTYYPTWITDASCGSGFVEMAEKLISCRK